MNPFLAVPWNNGEDGKLLQCHTSKY